VDHINRLRLAGSQWREAVIEGCLERARPIFMTTATTVLGMLPLLLFLEDKRGIWYALALATVGGLSVSSVLVLTVSPALYAIFAGRDSARWRQQTAPLGSKPMQRSSPS